MSLNICWQIWCIIIFHFENVTFFNAKLGLDICPRVDNQTSGDTLQDLTQPLSGKIAMSQLSTNGYWSKVPHQPVRITEETLESGNLFSSS